VRRGDRAGPGHREAAPPRGGPSPETHHPAPTRSPSRRPWPGRTC
jgi:hypothetical protein